MILSECHESPALKPPSYTTCIHVEATNVCMWYIVVVVFGFAMVLGITGKDLTEV
jgi:hypothetical protein